MPDSGWNTFLAGAFGLLTASSVLWLTQRWEKQKRQEDRDADEARWRTDREAEERRWRNDRASEERRWYSDRLIERKFDAVSKLHTALVDCYFTLNLYLNVPPGNFAEFKERVEPKEDVYLRALVMAEVYLNAEQDEKMHTALGVFRQAVRFIYLRLPNESGVSRTPDFDPWENFMESYAAGVEVVRSLLNPETAAGAGNALRSDGTLAE